MIRELTGRKVLLWLTGFFAFVMAVNTLFIVISLKTFRGEDEQKPYLQGVEYNRTLALRAEQSKIGWRASIGATRRPSGELQISVSLNGANGAPEPHTALRGELRHPADENKDRLEWYKAVIAYNKLSEKQKGFLIKSSYDTFKGTDAKGTYHYENKKWQKKY